VEALGQDMLDQTAEEFHRCQGRGLAVLGAKGDGIVADVDEPAESLKVAKGPFAWRSRSAAIILPCRSWPMTLTAKRYLLLGTQCETSSLDFSLLGRLVASFLRGLLPFPSEIMLKT